MLDNVDLCAVCIAGENSELFTLDIDHDGLFCGLAGSVDFFDDCSCDTISIMWIQEMLARLGHSMDEKLHVYWSKPVHNG
jgi:hypothetical protein